MTSAKTTWHKPELIVLTRSRPEEAVLSACKGKGGVLGPGIRNCGKQKPKVDCYNIQSS